MVWPMNWEGVAICGNLRAMLRKGQLQRVAPKTLLQRRVLSFGLLEDGDVGVGVFPEVGAKFTRGYAVCAPGGVAAGRRTRSARFVGRPAGGRSRRSNSG